MRNRRVLAISALMIGATVAGAADTPPTVDELLPVPVFQGGSTHIRQPAAVRTSSADLVEAASVQDAVNAAQARQKEELTRSPVAGTNAPADFLIFGSGVGAVSTGLAVFEEHVDLTASRMAQREAYVTAYQRAKANLLQLLRSTELEKNQELQSRIRRATDGENAGDHQTQMSSQAITTRAAGLLRGYVVFEVKDEPDTADRSVHQVFVTLAATPATMARAQRVSAVQIEAESLQSGLQQLMIELQQGLVPPIGARVVDVPTTGERAFVGFGSAVLMAGEPLAPTVQGDRAAEQAARLVALQSLMELLKGDEMTWEGRLRTRQQQTLKSFEPLAATDPLQPKEPQQVQRLAERRREFLAEFEQEETIRAVGRGTIPPGTVSRTWHNPQQGWAFGIVVWVPSTARLAADIVGQMERPAIDDIPVNPAPSKSSGVPPSEQRRVPLPIGPTGRLNPDDY